VDHGDQPVHLPQGLRGEQFRIRLGCVRGAVPALHHRHDRAVPVEPEEECTMSETMALVTPEPKRARLSVESGSRPRPAGSGSRAVGRTILYVVLIVAAAAMLTPFFWMVMSSLKDANSVFSVPVRWIPEIFVWENYVEIWTRSDILTWIRNTLILSVTVTALQVLTGSFAAYGFSRITFPGRNALFLLYVATIAVP